MKTLSKSLAIAAVVAAIGGAGLAVAQPAGPDGYGMMGPGRGGGYGMMGFMHGGGGYGMMGPGRGGYGPGMMRGSYATGFADPAARLDGLKTELGIRPEQAAAWDGYVKAVGDAGQQIQAIRGGMDFEKLRTMSWNDHQAYMAQVHDRRAAAFKSVDAASTTLVAALDDTQKARLLLPVLERAGGGMMGWPGDGRR